MSNEHRIDDPPAGGPQKPAPTADEQALARALAEVISDHGAPGPSEARWLQRTAAQLRADAQSAVPPELAREGLSELMRRIAAERRGSHPPAPAAPPESWMVRAGAAVASLFGVRAPVLAAALGVVLLVQAGAIAVLLARPAQLESLGAPAGSTRGDAVLLTVAFHPQASEAAIRAALGAARAQIVMGPSAIGLYTVSVPRNGADDAIAALRGTAAVVQSVQR